MNIAILGTGGVGRTIASHLVQRGLTVCMGSRSADNPAATAWAASAGPRASHATFAQAAASGELIFNCTSGQSSLAALQSIPAAALDGKILIDVANPLDYSGGSLRLTVCNTDSLGEQIQRACPGARVVKALNTMNAAVMVNPALVPGQHELLLCGNDPAARAEVSARLGEWFGWQRILDLGDLTHARGMEMLLPLWISLSNTLGTYHFNFHIAR